MVEMGNGKWGKAEGEGKKRMGMGMGPVIELWAPPVRSVRPHQYLSAPYSSSSSSSISFFCVIFSVSRPKYREILLILISLHALDYQSN